MASLFVESLPLNEKSKSSFQRLSMPTSQNCHCLREPLPAALSFSGLTG